MAYYTNGTKVTVIVDSEKLEGKIVGSTDTQGLSYGDRELYLVETYEYLSYREIDMTTKIILVHPENVVRSLEK